MDMKNVGRIMSAATEGGNIHGTIGEAVAAFRNLKSAKMQAKGQMGVAFTDRMDGLNVRSVYCDAESIYRLMDEFRHSFKMPLTTPYVDTARNALVSTDGVGMILCDIPRGVSKEEAVGAGFKWNVEEELRWWGVIPDREVSDYNLANLKRVAVVEKGGELHSLIMGIAACAKAYEFTDKDGYWHPLYVGIGRRLYNARALAKMVTGVFKLGNDSIGLYEQTGYTGWDSCDHTPIHVVGLDGANNSRGLLMPVRHYGTTDGVFRFPVEEEAANAA